MRGGNLTQIPYTTFRRQLEADNVQGIPVQRKKESTTFEYAAGIVSARRELEEIVEFLKNPGMFERIVAKNPKGALLAPPGQAGPFWTGEWCRIGA
jgi:ATP-dependent Zn protease